PRHDDGAHPLPHPFPARRSSDLPAVTRTVTVDTVPPKPTGLQAAGGSPSVTATFSKPMLCSTVSPTAFSVSMPGPYRAVTAVSRSEERRVGDERSRRGRPWRGNH